MATTINAPSIVRADPRRGGLRGARRRVGRPRARDAAAEPVPAARLAHRVVAPLRRGGRARGPRRAARTGAWSGRAARRAPARAACAWRASWAGITRCCRTLLVAEDAEPRARRPAHVAGRRERGDVADLHGLPGGQPDRRGARRPPRRSSSGSRRPCSTSRRGWDEVYRAKTTSKKRNLHKRRRRQLGELGELERHDRARARRARAGAGGGIPRCTRLRWEGRPDGSGFATRRRPAVPPRRDAARWPRSTSRAS